MSKNAKGILGDQVGKVGPVVGKRWMGLQVYSAYQPNVRNPKTAKQQLVRAKFTLLSQLSRGFRSAINLGFHDESIAANKTRYNMFFKANYGNITGNSIETLGYDPEDIVVAAGSLANVVTGVADFSAPMQVTVPITSPSSTGEPGYNVNDTVYLVAYSEATGFAVISDGSATRNDNSVSVNVPASFQGAQACLYVFTVAENGQISSASTFAGVGNIL